MLTALGRLGIPQKCVSVISMLYTKIRFVVRDNFSTSTEFSQEEGIRQGCNLSPFLFIALLTVIMADAEQGYLDHCTAHGIPRSKHILKFVGYRDLLFADDTNLVGSCLEHIQIFFHCIITEARYYGLELNTNKTKLIAINAPAGAEVIDLTGEIIRESPTAKTLGFNFGVGVTPKKVVSQRCAIMLSEMDKYRWLWRSNVVLLTKKVSFFNSSYHCNEVAFGVASYLHDSTNLQTAVYRTVSYVAQNTQN